MKQAHLTIISAICRDDEGMCIPIQGVGQEVNQAIDAFNKSVDKFNINHGTDVKYLGPFLLLQPDSLSHVVAQWSVDMREMEMQWDLDVGAAAIDVG